MNREKMEALFEEARQENRKLRLARQRKQGLAASTAHLLKNPQYAICPRCNKRARLRYIQEMCKVCRKKHPEEKLREEALAGPPPALDRINLTRWLLRVMPSKGKKKDKRLYGKLLTKSDPIVTAFETAYEAEVERIAKLSPEARIMAATMLWRRVHDANQIALDIFPYFPIKHLPPNIEDYQQRRYLLMQLTEPGNSPVSLDPVLVKKIETVKGKTVITLRSTFVVEQTEEQARQMLGETHKERMELEELVAAAQEKY